ncbi:transposase domain-containing protein [Streptomyces sp. NBC_00154]|uniref:transposase domain-containing protein n=1 Tax=Streptomyces sp. NBC_00154 TaxID=2975670 RepID=UPI0022593FB8|nr:transposase domain-containing protein [Streptomyces sp. NBC_00154]MCX5316695.1 transposase domain-containing protein [Streptomyces sp. NBC_00154]
MAACGRLEQRRRLFPARLVVYFVLGRVSSRDQWVVRVRSLIQIIEARRWRPAR